MVISERGVDGERFFPESIQVFREGFLDDARHFINEACSRIQQRPRSISKRWVLLVAPQPP